MSKETNAVAANAAESQTASANVTVGALGQMLTERKGKRASSAAAKTSDADPAEATASEQTEASTDDTTNETETSLESAAAKPEAEATAEDDAEKQGDDETEAEAETDAEEKVEKPSKAIREMQKRIDKLTAKLAAAEERAAQAAQQPAPQAQPAAQPQKRQADPLDEQFARDRDVVQMDGELAGLDNFMAWAADNPDGGEFTENGKTYQLNGDELKQYRLQSERQARRLESRREARLEALRTQFVSAREKCHADAVKLYPWIEQKESAEFQEAVALLRANPALMQKPDFELVVARMVAGERLEREALKKSKPAAKPKPVVATTPAKVVTHTLNATPKVDATRKAAGEAEAKFRAEGSVDNLATMLAQRRSERLKAAQAA